jgi:hypothetical protein
LRSMRTGKQHKQVCELLWHFSDWSC